MVFLKKETMYHHKIVRFHYTEYDVRRGTDVINPGTSRCNIMMLAHPPETTENTDDDCHPFLYARVLGAYHANVIYTGPGMKDFRPHRIDFLWVRWYEMAVSGDSGWARKRLDSLRFRAMADTTAYGFVDPNDVLRTCHIIPNFSRGRRHADGIGLSGIAKDGQEHKLYYVARSVLCPTRRACLHRY